MGFKVKSEMTGKEIVFICKNKKIYPIDVDIILSFLNESCEELVKICDHCGYEIIDTEYSEIPADIEITENYVWRF